MSEETKRKISEANSRRNMTSETHIRRSESKKKKIVAIHDLTGEKIVFDSQQAAAEYFSVSPSSVYRWCHKIKNASNDYTFNYLSADND